jgi:hypothetical protein
MPIELERLEKPFRKLKRREATCRTRIKDARRRSSILRRKSRIRPNRSPAAPRRKSQRRSGLKRKRNFKTRVKTEQVLPAQRRTLQTIALIFHLGVLLAVE